MLSRAVESARQAAAKGSSAGMTAFRSSTVAAHGCESADASAFCPVKVHVSVVLVASNSVWKTPT